MSDSELAAVVHHSEGSYPVVAGWGLLDILDSKLQKPVSKVIQ
jgi:hypothetical protein